MPALGLGLYFGHPCHPVDTQIPPARTTIIISVPDGFDMISMASRARLTFTAIPDGFNTVLAVGATSDSNIIAVPDGFDVLSLASRTPLVITAIPDGFNASI